MQRIFDPRTKDVQYSVPNVEALGFDWPELKAAVESFNHLREDLDRTVAKVRELTEARRGAEDQDQRALATAIREGKDDPGEKHTAKIDAEIRNAERRRDALRLAIQEQAAVITSVIDEHRSSWRSEVEEKLPATQDRLSRAVAEVEAARGELQGLHGLSDWLQEPGKAYAPKDAAKNTNVIIQGGITRQGGEPTLASIREEARSA